MPMDTSNAPLVLQRLYRNAATNTVGIAISADADSSRLDTAML